MNFREYINESIKQNKVDKVIVKGLERYIVQGSENGKPYVITSSGEKRVGKKYFENLKDEDYFKTEKEAEKYLNEGIFSRKKDEDWDFAESFIINALRKIGMKPKGKLKDKTSSMYGAVINMWQFVEKPFTYEQKIELVNFLKKYKFEQNEASRPEDVEGTFYADGTQFTFIASNDFSKKGDGKAYIRIFRDADNIKADKS